MVPTLPIPTLFHTFTLPIPRYLHGFIHGTKRN